MSIRPLFKANDQKLIEKFHNVENFNTLADLVEFNAHGLKRILSEIRHQEKHYNEFFIKKKSGGERQILAPDHKLKLIQRRLAYVLSLLYMGRISVHGFRRGKSIITNAERHVRRKALLNLDLENFFPTIHFGRIRGILQTHPYNLSKAGSTIIAGFCCYKSRLPQGAPTSPIVSNMICSKLDYELQKFAYEEHCVYSRYADDIVFSTNARNGFSQNMLEGGASEWKIGPKLQEIINKNGFFVNQKKTRVRFYTERQEVTGLIVNAFPNIKREFVREVRIMLHMWKKFGIKKASERYQDMYGNDFYKSLQGKINFIKLVKTERNNTYKVLAEKFNKEAGAQIFKIVAVKNWPRSKHFAVGDLFSGLEFLKEIFSLAEKEIFISDNYLMRNVVSLLEKIIVKDPLIEIKLLISSQNPQKYKDCIDSLKEMIALHKEAKIDCRKSLRNPIKKQKFHDRYVIIDNVEIYHSGHSLGELGKSSSNINQILEQTTKKETYDDLRYQFDNSEKIILS